jgi:uncharacterized membrane protein
MMKKAKDYCGLMFGVGLFLIVIGVISIVAFNVNIAYQPVILYFFFAIGSLLVFLSFVISKIIDNIEEELLQLRDRTFKLDIKMNEQKRK